jgi:hypothetical protein
MKAGLALKPAFLVDLGDTAEAVPFPKTDF